MADPNGFKGSLPGCVASCLIADFVKAGCDATNILTCFCTNIPLQRNISSCVQLSCSSEDQAAASKAQQTTCAGVPIQSRSNFLLINLVVLNAILWVLVALRFLARWKITKSFWWDDWAMLLAVVFDICSSVLEFLLIAFGLGKHVWDIPYNNVENLEKLFYAINIFYILDLFTIKVSIVFLYLRIFSEATTFRRICWGTQSFLVALCLTFVLLVGLRCNPISDTWHNGIVPGAKCLSYHLVVVVGAGLNIATDVWILLLPIPQLLGLVVSSSKKLQLILMFNIGVFACVASMVRLKYAADYQIDSPEPTYDDVDFVFWTTIETGVAFFCANLPSVRPLLRVVAPNIFGNRTAETDKPSERNGSIAWTASANRRSIRISDYERREFERIASPDIESPDTESPEPWPLQEIREYKRDGAVLEQKRGDLSPSPRPERLYGTETWPLQSPTGALCRDHRWI